MASEIMNDDEAGRYLGGNASPILASRLAKWRSEGTGPKFVRVGKAVRYRRVDLDEWLLAQTVAPRVNFIRAGVAV